MSDPATLTLHKATLCAVVDECKHRADRDPGDLLFGILVGAHLDDSARASVTAAAGACYSEELLASLRASVDRLTAAITGGE